MATKAAIIITSDNPKTYEEDMNKFQTLIENIAPIAEKRLDAEFLIEGFSDKKEAADQWCPHQFGIVDADNGNSFIDPFKDKFPDNPIIECVRCMQSFSLFNASEIMHSTKERGVHFNP